MATKIDIIFYSSWLFLGLLSILVGIFINAPIGVITLVTGCTALFIISIILDDKGY